jgi:serine/threonine protein kinase
MSSSSSNVSDGASSAAELPKVPQIQWSSLQFGAEPRRQLGEGSFGKVYAAKYCGIDVAVKEFEGVPFPEYMMQKFEKEAQIMWNVGVCANAVKLLGICMEPMHPCLVMEFMSKGALTHFLYDDANVISEQAKWLLGLEICEGVSSLHDKDVIHGDLKSNNILLGPGFHAKLADFGLAKVDICAVP